MERSRQNSEQGNPIIPPHGKIVSTLRTRQVNTTSGWKGHVYSRNKASKYYLRVKRSHLLSQQGKQILPPDGRSRLLCQQGKLIRPPDEKVTSTLTTKHVNTTSGWKVHTYSHNKASKYYLQMEKSRLLSQQGK